MYYQGAEFYDDISGMRLDAEGVKASRKKELEWKHSLDLTVVDPDDGQAWDFDRKAKRRKALRNMCLPKERRC